MAEPSHLSAAAAQFPQFHFARSTITSASLQTPSYLRQLAAFPLPASAQHCLAALPASISRAQCTHQLIAAVSSDNDVKLYNYAVGTAGAAAASSSLEHYGVLRGHKRAIHDVAFHNVNTSFAAGAVSVPQGRVMLSTASEDATVRFWDVRQQKAALEYKHPRGKPYFSCASAGDLLLGASGPTLFVWDLRRGPGGAALAENDEFHTEDINALAFHPLDAENGTRTIVTGSEDGLICMLKPDAGEDQDEWLDCVLNVENPVRRFGFFGPAARWMWALSTVETLTLWDVESCERVADFTDIRDNLSRSAHMNIDYLIGAHYDQQSQHLFLAAGCNDGQLVLAHVNKAEIQPFCRAHFENRPVDAAAAAAASSSAAAASSGGAAPSGGAVSAVTGFALQPLSAESPFALSSLQVIGPPSSAAAGGAAGAGGDSDMEDEGEDVLKDGEVVYGSAVGRTAEEDAAMEAAEALAMRKPVDPTAQGHTATIRDVLWFDGALVSGGEDSRLCLWTTQAGASAAGSSPSATLKVKQHGANNIHSPSPPAPSVRHKPY